jgi:hypothetical protein
MAGVRGTGAKAPDYEKGALLFAISLAGRVSVVVVRRSMLGLLETRFEAKQFLALSNTLFSRFSVSLYRPEYPKRWDIWLSTGIQFAIRALM